jgi:membrane protein
MPPRLRDAWSLLRQTFTEWSEDKVPRLAATLAYYTLFSLAPLLVIAIAVAGLVFGREAARGEVVTQLDGLIGRAGAEAIQSLIDNAARPEAGWIATVVGLATLLFGASGVFAQLQDALNTIWEVRPKPGRGLLSMLRQRFVSFTMVLGTGFLLLVSLVVSAALAAAGRYFQGLVPGSETFWQVLTAAISFAATTLLFGLIFKVVPDVKVWWRDVWIGAVATAGLFTLGRYLIGLYLGRSAIGSTYGAAASLVIVILWVYYSAQILFLGAEFTQVWARRHGRGIAPAAYAERVAEREREEEGLERGPEPGPEHRGGRIRRRRRAAGV